MGPLRYHQAPHLTPRGFDGLDHPAANPEAHPNPCGRGGEGVPNGRVCAGSRAFVRPPEGIREAPRSGVYFRGEGNFARADREGGGWGSREGRPIKNEFKLTGEKERGNIPGLTPRRRPSVHRVEAPEPRSEVRVIDRAPKVQGGLNACEGRRDGESSQEVRQRRLPRWIVNEVPRRVKGSPHQVRREEGLCKGGGSPQRKESQRHQKPPGTYRVFSPWGILKDLGRRVSRKGQ